LANQEKELNRIKLENEVLKENERQRKLDDELHRIQQAKKKQEKEEHQYQLELPQQQKMNDDDDEEEEEEEELIIDKKSKINMSNAAQRQRALQSAFDKGELKEEVKKIAGRSKGNSKVVGVKKTKQQQEEDAKKWATDKGYIGKKPKRKNILFIN
jgi:hypothetical protein